MTLTEKIIGNPFTVPWLIGMIVFWIVRRGDYKNNALFFINLNSESEKVGLMVVLSAIFNLTYWLISSLINICNFKLGLVAIFCISLLVYALTIYIIFKILRNYHKKHCDNFGFIDFNNNILEEILSNGTAIYSFWNSDGNLINYGSIGNADVISPQVGNIALSNNNCETLRGFTDDETKEILLSTVSAYVINMPSGITIRKHLVENVNKEINNRILDIN